MNVITDAQLKKNLVANLKRILARNGVTPYRLAKLIDEPQNSVYRMCRGDNVPNAVILARVSEALDVTIDDLLVAHKCQVRAAG
jgi:transcriptional regulator with XRE-family HTH domain